MFNTPIQIDAVSPLLPGEVRARGHTVSPHPLGEGRVRGRAVSPLPPGEGRVRGRVHSPGFSLVELIVALAILAASFAAVLSIVAVLADGMYFETIQGEQQTRISGTVCDMLAELRQASMSPNFNIATPAAAATTNPSASQLPSITFDMPSTTNAAGAIVWGSKITYRLALKEADNGLDNDGDGIIGTAQILRDETPVGMATTTTIVEDHVPLRVSETVGGVTNTYWGFTVEKSNKAALKGFTVYDLTNPANAPTVFETSDNVIIVTIRRAGNTRKDMNTTAVEKVSNSSTLQGSSTQGKNVNAYIQRIFYLRNPQTVPVPPS